ncbi:DUF3942 family protein [Bacillus cereus group sp. BfR-BA-01331]|uniref:DUF3942 family protein n=1 Tax=Bacillus cereus group sp. BfR-BA-01331 TaxID=2920307 RepID=UPI001F5843C6|nr:DUF3942 family protein [Bacillus cereus group sp. BfR-BA-01331]
MNFQAEFIKKAKYFLGEDLDEKIITDGHSKLISDYVLLMEKGIGTVKNHNFKIGAGHIYSRVNIDGIEFYTKVNNENNTIEVTKTINGEVTSLDTIVVQDGELFALGRNEKFTTVILEDYLRETFGEKLGL